MILALYEKLKKEKKGHFLQVKRSKN